MNSSLFGPGDLGSNLESLVTTDGLSGIGGDPSVRGMTTVQGRCWGTCEVDSLPWGYGQEVSLDTRGLPS